MRRESIIPTMLLLALVAASPSTRAQAPTGSGSLPAQETAASIFFTDISDDAGIDFRHSFGDYDLSNIVEGTGPGVAFFDYNGDSFPDLYFLNGTWHPDVSDNKSRDLRGKLSNALYRNNGDGTFTEVTAEAGVGDQGYGMGASAADYDSDGDLDLYVLNYGPNVLYRNNGNGTFTDVTETAGIAEPLWSVSAPWLDYDGDGDLDLYVANYLEYDAGAFRDFYAAQNYPGPLAYKGQPDHLFRNNGDGTFTDVTAEVGLLAEDGRAMSALTADLDLDGDQDIYVANDAMSSSLWLNDGRGNFVDEAVVRGVAFGEGGQGASSMGPAIGDIDRNGLLDLWIPDMGYGTLLSQREETLYADVTAQANLTLICGQYTGWGSGLVDFDNDGYLDVMVANGNAHHLYTEEDVLARNDGTGRYVDVARSAGDYFSEKYVGRGVAFADIDNDGDIDAVIANLDERPRLLRNDTNTGNHWLVIVPLLADSGSVALGARVTVTAKSLRSVHPVHAVTGYLSASDPRAHFGLGAADRADVVEIHWPDGEVQTLENVAGDQILEVVQGAAQVD
jgi:hypothetical protein